MRYKVSNNSFRRPENVLVYSPRKSRSNEKKVDVYYYGEADTPPYYKKHISNSKRHRKMTYDESSYGYPMNMIPDERSLYLIKGSNNKRSGKSHIHEQFDSFEKTDRNSGVVIDKDYRQDQVRISRRERNYILPSPPTSREYIVSENEKKFQVQNSKFEGNIDKNWRLPLPPNAVHDRFSKTEPIDYVREERNNYGRVLSVTNQHPRQSISNDYDKGRFHPVTGKSSSMTKNSSKSSASPESIYNELNFIKKKEDNRLNLPKSNHNASFSSNEIIEKDSSWTDFTRVTNDIGGSKPSSTISSGTLTPTDSTTGKNGVKDAYLIPMVVEDKRISDDESKEKNELKAKQLKKVILDKSEKVKVDEEFVNYITNESENKIKKNIFDKKKLERVIDVDISFQKNIKKRESLLDQRNSISQVKNGISNVTAVPNLPSGLVVNSATTPQGSHSKQFRNFVNEIISKKKTQRTFEKDETEKWQEKNEEEKLKDTKNQRRRPTLQDWMNDAKAVRRRQSGVSSDSKEVKDPDHVKSHRATTKTSEGQRKFMDDNLLAPTSSKNVSKTVSFEDDTTKIDAVDNTGEDDVFHNNDIKDKDDAEMRDKWQRVLLGGRRESVAECKERLFGRTIYAAPTYCNFQAGWHTEISFDKLNKIEECRQFFLSRSFENTNKRPSDAEVMSRQAQGVYDNGGAYLRLYCAGCDHWESDSCCEDEEHDEKKSRKRKQLRKTKTIPKK